MEKKKWNLTSSNICAVSLVRSLHLPLCHSLVLPPLCGTKSHSLFIYLAKQFLFFSITKNANFPTGSSMNSQRIRFNELLDSLVREPLLFSISRLFLLTSHHIQPHHQPFTNKSAYFTIYPIIPSNIYYGILNFLPHFAKKPKAPI